MRISPATPRDVEAVAKSMRDRDVAEFLARNPALPEPEVAYLKRQVFKNGRPTEATFHLLLASLAEHYGEGVKVLAYYDAADPDRIYLTDGKGRWIGALARTERFSRKDLASTAKNIATKKGMLNAAIARNATRSPNVAERREEDIAQNLEVLSRADAITLAPIPSADVAAAPDSHDQLAAAAQRHIATRRSEVAQAKHEAKLGERASSAIAGFAPAHAAEEGEDNGL